MRFVKTAVVVLLVGIPGLARAFAFTDLEPTPVQVFECPRWLASAPRVRLIDEERVVVVAWNPEGVADLVGKFEPAGIARDRYQFAPTAESNRALSPWKFAAKQRKILRAGTFSGLKNAALPHFVVAPEVESSAAAERLFNEEALAGRYRTFLTRGNDTRGIDVAFAVRADLDVTVQFESHRHVRWHDPVENARVRVFTRDLPALIIRDRATNDVLFVLIGQHAKSMRDRAGGRDKRSAKLRAAQFAAAREIVDRYRARFTADVPIIMAGDFNADVPTAPELAPLKAVLGDAFDLVGARERTTHTYHPSEGVVIESQLDALLVSDSVRPYVERALVLPEYHHLSGRLLGTPQSLTDRLANYPSDHRAIALVLRAADMYRARESR